MGWGRKNTWWMQNNWKELTTPGPRKGSRRQNITSLHWQTMWQSATIPLIGKWSYQPRTRIGQKEVSERLSASGRQDLTSSIAQRGATISQMCIPNCYSLPPHLVVAARSTEDDVWLDIEINLLVIISVLVLIQKETCTIFILGGYFCSHLEFCHNATSKSTKHHHNWIPWSPKPTLRHEDHGSSCSRIRPISVSIICLPSWQSFWQPSWMLAWSYLLIN